MCVCVSQNDVLSVPEMVDVPWCSTSKAMDFKGPQMRGPQNVKNHFMFFFTPLEIDTYLFLNCNSHHRSVVTTK